MTLILTRQETICHEPKIVIFHDLLTQPEMQYMQGRQQFSWRQNKSSIDTCPLPCPSLLLPLPRDCPGAG